MWSNSPRGNSTTMTTTMAGMAPTTVTNTTTKNLGMTAPISTAGPEPRDLELSVQLEEALKPHDVFESDDELTHRLSVLSQLNDLVKQWVKVVFYYFHLYYIFCI